LEDIPECIAEGTRCIAKQLTSQPNLTSSCAKVGQFLADLAGAIPEALGGSPEGTDSYPPPTDLPSVATLLVRAVVEPSGFQLDLALGDPLV